jgi:hypothetical protein
MAEESGAGSGLEVDEDIRIERFFWVVERIGWGAMTVLLAAALLGFLGEGPLSRAAAGDTRGTFRVDYERFCRRGKPTEVTFRMGPAAPRDGNLAITVSSAYIDRFIVDVVTPDPHAVKGGESAITYLFLLEEGAAGSTIVFRLEPKSMGRAEADVSVQGSAPLRFSQLIYP